MSLAVKVIFTTALLSAVAMTVAAAAPTNKPGVSLDALSRAATSASATPSPSKSVSKADTAKPNAAKPEISKLDSLIETKRKAEAGDAQAQLALGQQFATMQKYAAAEQWFRAAGLQGEPAAIFALAKLYQSGQGSGADMVKANPTNYITLLKLAANLGYGKAHYALALAYNDGRNVRKDLIRAYSHMKLSEPDAQRESTLNQMVAEMAQEQIAAAEKIVAEFKPAKFNEAFGDLVFESIKVTGIFGGSDQRIAMMNGKQLGAGQGFALLVGGLEAHVKLDEVASDGVFVTYGSMERKIKPQRL